MQPKFYKVSIPEQASVNIRHDIKANFGRAWHFHPEFELHLVLKGQGLRFVGDKIDRFSSGEIVLLGANLPHKWHCDRNYFIKNKINNIEAIVIQFPPDFLGKEFLNRKESYFILQLFERAKRGLKIVGKTRPKVKKLMERLVKQNGMAQIISLLGILDILSQTSDYFFITNHYEPVSTNKIEINRLDEVYNYTLSHFSEPINLERIAYISNLTVTSFCRYFKNITNKTYHQFLMEIRISQACKMLIDDSLTTEQISERCGFNSNTTFFNSFRKITGMTPGTYKKVYLDKL